MSLSTVQQQYENAILNFNVPEAVNIMNNVYDQMYQNLLDVTNLHPDVISVISEDYINNLYYQFNNQTDLQMSDNFNHLLPLLFEKIINMLMLANIISIVDINKIIDTLNFLLQHNARFLKRSSTSKRRLLNLIRNVNNSDILINHLNKILS